MWSPKGKYSLDALQPHSEVALEDRQWKIFLLGRTGSDAPGRPPHVEGGVG